MVQPIGFSVNPTFQNIGSPYSGQNYSQNGFDLFNRPRAAASAPTGSNLMTQLLGILIQAVISSIGNLGNQSVTPTAPTTSAASAASTAPLPGNTASNSAVTTGTNTMGEAKSANAQPLDPTQKRNADAVRRAALMEAEKLVGTNRNNVQSKFGKSIGEIFGIDGKENPLGWCAEAVATMYNRALGTAKDFDQQFYQGKFKQRGSLQEAQPGDMINLANIQGNASQHVGMLKQINADGSVETYEGNVSGGTGVNGFYVRKYSAAEAQRMKFYDIASAAAAQA